MKNKTQKMNALCVCVVVIGQIETICWNGKPSFFFPSRMWYEHVCVCVYMEWSLRMQPNHDTLYYHLLSLNKRETMRRVRKSVFCGLWHGADRHQRHETILRIFSHLLKKFDDDYQRTALDFKLLYLCGKLYTHLYEWKKKKNKTKMFRPKPKEFYSKRMWLYAKILYH